jgi:hypothetical protein
MAGVFQNIDPPPPSPPGEGGGGSIFWKTSDTALYTTYVSTLVLYILSPCLCLEQQIIPPLEAGVLLLQLTVRAQLLLHQQYEYRYMLLRNNSGVGFVWYLRGFTDRNISKLVSSVEDPRHFDTDPDPHL